MRAFFITATFTCDAERCLNILDVEADYRDILNHRIEDDVRGRATAAGWSVDGIGDRCPACNRGA